MILAFLPQRQRVPFRARVKKTLFLFRGGFRQAGVGDGRHRGDGGDALVIVENLGELLFERLFLLHDALHVVQ